MTTTPTIQSPRELANARQDELAAIVDKHGIITPELVIEQAKPKSSPLHSLFEWNNSEAARKFRLVQAAMYIRAQARIIRNSDDETAIRVRAYISLPSQRGSGHYQAIDTVMDDEAMRSEMVQDALADYEKFRTKWQHLTELERLFAVANPEIEQLKT